MSHIFEGAMIHGIIGRSGAGKTTLLRCLVGLDTTYTGHIHFRESPRNIGFVAQSYSLLKRRTILENVLLPVDLCHEKSKNQDYLQKAIKILDYVGLDSKKDHYPHQLSGGQQQRAAIARALILDPQILLCDELTSALDPETSKEILDLIKSLKKTTLFVTHDLEIIKECADRVCVLDQGLMVEQGFTIDIFRSPKHPCTLQMINEYYRTTLPEHWRDRIHQTPGHGDEALYRLDFMSSNATGPLVSWIVSHFDVNINIVSGNLDYIQNEPLGHLIVSLNPTFALKDILKDKGVKTHFLGYLRWNG